MNNILLKGDFMKTVDKEFGTKLNHVNYIDREAVYGILLNKDNVLVIKTPRGYFLPGGGIECGETAHECLIREMIEEAGLIIDIDSYIGKSVLYDMSPKDKTYYSMYGSYYLVSESGQAKQTETDHKTIYMTIDDAIKHLKLVHQVWALKKIKQSLSTNK